MHKELEITQAELPLKVDPLLPFLQSAYGREYKGDDNIRWFFNRITRAIGLFDNNNELAALGLIEGAQNKRLIVAATSQDIDLFGRRSKLMERLFQACLGSGSANWMTISRDYPEIGLIAERAGMKRVTDSPTVLEILRKAGLRTHYSLAINEDGVPAIVTRSGPNTGNVQFLWVPGGNPEQKDEAINFPDVSSQQTAAFLR